VAERRTFAVVPTGVGRKDYSENIEYATEPLIRSWQSRYSHSEVVSVPAGGSVVRTLVLTIEHVVMLHDLGISANRNVLIGLYVEAYNPDTGIWAPIASEMGYQKVIMQISAGFPIFDRYRITITNHSSHDLDIPFNAAGIETTEEKYYLAVHVGVP